MRRSFFLFCLFLFAVRAFSLPTDWEDIENSLTIIEQNVQTLQTENQNLRMQQKMLREQLSQSEKNCQKLEKKVTLWRAQALTVSIVVVPALIGTIAVIANK